MDNMYANNEQLYEQLNFRNLIPGMDKSGILGPGRYIDVKDKKVHKFPAIDTELPWIYVNTNPELFCMEYQMIVKGFGFIPRRCLECWKVVVKPRSFHELMLLLDFEEEISKQNPKFWCKCGVETRWFVDRNYGGYFYCRGKEVGLSRLKTITEMVHDKISPNIDVILKRYCTEFELSFGPSDQYKRPDFADDIEDRFWDSVNLEPSSQRQPDIVRDNIIYEWMKFAWGRGDRTVILYNNGRPLVPPSLTYGG